MNYEFSILHLSDAFQQNKIDWILVDILVTGDEVIPDTIKIPPHILIIKTFDEESISHLLRYPGADFIAKIGHADVNLWGPMQDYTLLPEDILLNRVKRGVSTGKHLNTIGHLLSGDRFVHSSLTVTLLDFIERLKETAFREGFSPAYRIECDMQEVHLSLAEEAASLFINEIIANWHHHSSGDEVIEIKKGENDFLLTCSNKTNNTLPHEHLTSLIRRPFVRWGAADTSGLGYFIISLIASYGALKWSTHYEKERFSLLLSFS